MLQVKNLTINHTKDNRVLLEDLSFTLNPGDKAAVIGEEGNGKSTLLKLIYDEALVENYISYTGEIIKHRVRLGYLPQELSEREKRLTAYEFMCSCTEQSPTHTVGSHKRHMSSICLGVTSYPEGFFGTPNVRLSAAYN